VEIYRERVDGLTQERNEALQVGMKLKAKVECMNDIMRIAIEEN
jgi:hypothetical protein